MATQKQLAALKKARAARKKNLAKKSPTKKRAKRKAIAKKRPVKRVAKRRAKSTRAKKVKRNPTTSRVYWIYTIVKKTKFWLQKMDGKWQFHSNKPTGMSESMKDSAMSIAKRFLTRLPAGSHIYLDVKKKQG